MSPNELRFVEPGNRAEFTLTTLPGRIINAKVDSIVWAQRGRQLIQFSRLPETGNYPQEPGRYPVKLTVDEKDRDVFLASGAGGHGAIYTEHLEEVQIVRMVLLRINTITKHLVLKL